VTLRNGDERRQSEIDSLPKIVVRGRYGCGMTSWRDGVSPAALADLDTMVSAAFRIAQQHLAESSEFAPFALVTSADGRLLAVDLDTSALGKHPEADEIAEATRAQLRTLAGSVRGTSLTLNTRLSRERTDAIEVRLEHREGVALLVLLPYKRPKFGGRVEYGAPKTFVGTAEVWA
jgi:hypothetical protein